jgi:transcriptional antiterminator Rof (Rho-off)
MTPAPKPYHPISCSLHDQMESASVLRQRVTLSVDSGDEATTLVGLIKDILVKDGEEFLIMDNDASIRLDRVNSLDLVVE